MSRPLRMRGSRPARTRVLVLLSGGIDSATTLAAYRHQRADLTAVFVDYGQPARRSEWRAAQAIAQHYGITLTRKRLGIRLSSQSGEFFGRNALFLLAAAATVGGGPLVVATGLHAFSPYYDTTPSFVSDMQRILDGYSAGTVTIAAPFLTVPKVALVRFALRHRVPLQLTYSCERRNAPACGQCRSCRDRRTHYVD